MTIIKYPEKVLRKKTAPVQKIDREIFDLAESMVRIMLENDGVGLAANQVNSLWRLFVINLKPCEEKPEPVVVINPQLIKTEDRVEDEEVCLSFPGLYLHIPRFNNIVLHYQNLYNERIVVEANGLLARAIQHEHDHLNGILFIDYVTEKEKEKLNQYLLKLNAQE